MSDVRITVRLERGHDNFSRDKDYEVLMVQGQRFLLIDDEAHFVWIDPAQATPVVVMRNSDRMFDLAIHRSRRRLEGLAGKPVVLTTWENLGFDPDEVNDDQMLVYRGVVDSYDGETLFLHRQDRTASRFGVLPKAIATIEEEAEP